MTKKDMASAIAQDSGVSQSQVKEIVQQVFGFIVDTLVHEGVIELRGFGVFKVKKRKPRQARNPRTGEKIWVPEKLAVTFRAGNKVQNRLQETKKLRAQRREVGSP
jgi:nucleoid DNA-binding protein